MKLLLDRVTAAYGLTPVLFGVSLQVAPGQVVALLGRNGMGKTTTVRTIVGALRPTSGRVQVDGAGVERWPGHRICRLGVGYVPEGRRIFKHLTVHEQLTAFARPRRDAETWSAGAIYDLFPALHARRGSPGGLLSGGEQQMLAIGRALMTSPSLLILDEATEGLAPMIRDLIWEVLRRLKSRGMTILVIDKNLGDVLPLADAAYVLEKGQVAWQGRGDVLLADAALQARLLSV